MATQNPQTYRVQTAAAPELKGEKPKTIHSFIGGAVIDVLDALREAPLEEGQKLGSFTVTVHINPSRTGNAYDIIGAVTIISPVEDKAFGCYLPTPHMIRKQSQLDAVINRLEDCLRDYGAQPKEIRDEIYKGTQSRSWAESANGLQMLIIAAKNSTTISARVFDHWERSVLRIITLELIEQGKWE